MSTVAHTVSYDVAFFGDNHSVSVSIVLAYNEIIGVRLSLQFPVVEPRMEDDNITGGNDNMPGKDHDLV